MIIIKNEIKILYTTKGLYLEENGIKSHYSFGEKQKNKVIIKNHIYNHKLFREWLEDKKLSLFMKNIIIYIYPDTSSLEIEFLEQLFKEQLIKKIAFKQLFHYSTADFLIFATTDCFYLLYPITSNKKYQIKDSKKDILNALKKVKKTKIKVYGDKTNLTLLAKRIEEKTNIPTYYQEDLFQLIKST